MPGHAHQSLLLWAVRKMTADGFVASGYDGKSAQGGEWNHLPAPFALSGIRPDAWGVHPNTLLIAFAEAKTLRDIDTKHTREQLRIILRVRMRGTHVACPLYIAVPRSGLAILSDVVESLELLKSPNIISIGVPDTLLMAA
jgi:hypothetical protein